MTPPTMPPEGWHTDLHYAWLCWAAYQYQPRMAEPLCVVESSGLCEWALVPRPADGALIVVFVGSNDVVDWVYNLNAGLRRDPTWRYRAHRGFADLWDQVRWTILSRLLKWRNDHGPYTKLVIAGHSLGGALAVLAARGLAVLGPTEHMPLSRVPLDLVTFGAPRVFDPDGCRAYPVLGRHYVYGADPVPHLPWSVPGRPYGNLPGRVWLGRPTGWRARLRRRDVGDHFIPKYIAALTATTRGGGA